MIFQLKNWQGLEDCQCIFHIIIYISIYNGGGEVGEVILQSTYMTVKGSSGLYMHISCSARSCNFVSPFSVQRCPLWWQATRGGETEATLLHIFWMEKWFCWTVISTIHNNTMEYRGRVMRGVFNFTSWVSTRSSLIQKDAKGQAEAYATSKYNPRATAPENNCFRREWRNECLRHAYC